MKLPSKTIVTRLGWATTAHGLSQGIRLVVSLIITRLLAPEVFGIMLIVNTLRTGAELLSDIGVGQNVIANPSGEERSFLNTAWTLQVIRSLILGIIIIICALPISKIYNDPIFSQILPIAGILTFLFGFESIKKFLAIRRLELSYFTLYEFLISLIGGIIQIAFAWTIPTVWGLIYANLATAIANVIISFILFPDKNLRFGIDRKHAVKMLTFGKWIFFSSVVYFIASNLDRLYLGATIPLAMLGVFGVARSLSEVVATLVARIGNSVVFPAIASAGSDYTALRRKLGYSRLPLILIAAAGVSAFVALSDSIIFLLYDRRYHQAAYMLPILAAGIWFTVIATMGEAVMLGIGRPAYGAIGNVAKLISLGVALPLAVPTYGIIGAVVVIAFADAIRYVPIWWAQKRSHLSFGRQDLAATLLMFAMIGIWRELFGMVGLTSGWTGWWSMAQEIVF